MSEWHDVTLADISDQRKGINYKSEYYCDEDSGHPFITIKCFVKGGGYQSRGIKYFDGPFAPQDRLKAGDVLISVTDLTRAGDIVGSPLQVPDFGSEHSALASMDCMKIAPKNGECDSEFLYFRMMLPDIRRQMVAYSAGSTVLHLDTKKVPSMKIRIPKDINHQRKLAGVLKLLTESIEQTEALIEKYSLVKAGMMRDLFTRGLTPDGKLRPPREEAPDLYKETAIGWIPKDWSTYPLDSVSDVIDPQPDHRTPPEQDEGIPYIGIGDFDKAGELKLGSCRKVIVAAFQKQRLRFKTQAGDVIFGKIGTIGQPKSLPIGDYALSANVILIKPNEHADYLRFTLDSSAFLKQISDITNTTSQPALGIETVRALTICMPTMEAEICAISSKLLACNERLKTEQRHLEKLKLKKSGLMHDLLTGEVPVSIDEPEAANV